MKTINAISRIKKELGSEPVLSMCGKNKKYSIALNGRIMSFYDTRDNDAESFYVVKEGADDGHNGFNGTFADNISQALILMK